MKKINILPHVLFDELCEKNNWNDETVDTVDDYAFISIIGTVEVRRDYLDDMQGHWFQHEHKNVLNLMFNDTETDFIWKGIPIIAMKMEDAERSVEFIEQNLGKTFIIHCKAGISRSQAFFRFLCDCYPEFYDEKECWNDDNPCTRPNRHVVRMLKRAYYKKHGLFGYGENNGE